MSYQHILTELKEFILTVTINRPHALNALNDELLDELTSILQESYHDARTRLILITGSGEKAFVAGADIKEIATLDAVKASKLSQKGQSLFKMIEDYPKPVIALVNGFALGGGCELAMACHVRIAWDNSKFGLPELNLGIIPGYGGTQRLSQLVGRGKALELILTGDMITAAEAKAVGLVNHVVATSEEGMALAMKMASKILSKAPVAVTQAIKSVNAGFTYEQNGYQAESEGFSACAATEDFKEGTAAFLEKRAPRFQGK